MSRVRTALERLERVAAAVVPEKDVFCLVVPVNGREPPGTVIEEVDGKPCVVVRRRAWRRR